MFIPWPISQYHIICKVLLERGKSNVKKTKDSFTPLMVCELLLETDSDLEESIPDIQLAALGGHIEGLS